MVVTSHKLTLVATLYSVVVTSPKLTLMATLIGEVHKNIATVRRTSSQNATRANLMLLSSNMENVSQGPLLINYQRCTSSRRYLYSAQW